MKSKAKVNLFISMCAYSVFVLWTLLVKFVDVQAIGPNNSKVGFSALNGAVRELIGANMFLYLITDWLGLVPIAFMVGFAILGLIQWIKRKSIVKVDHDILILGTFYVVVFLFYLLFEYVVLNFRPILIDGYLEASYPSSTTMLVMCVMPTAIIQFNKRMKNIAFRRFLTCAISIFIVFMVFGRLVSGVHWFSDIIGGIFLSVSLVSGYRFALINWHENVVV